MDTDVGRLQTRFQTQLVNLGYTKSVGQLPPSLVQNENLFNFVRCVTERLNTDHHISSEELTKFQELKSTGAVLEGDALQHALSQLGCSVGRGQSSPEAAARELEELKLKIASTKSQLSTVTGIKKRLSEHYASLALERDDFSTQKSICQRQYKAAMDTADQDNYRINTAAKELESSTQTVCAFHRGEEEGSQTKATPRMLSQISQEPYHSTEDRYLSELTAYTKKQFFEGIATMAAPHSTADPQCTDVDLDNKDQVLFRGVTQEQHKGHSQELARLQSIYPITELKYVNAKIAERFAESATSKAEEQLTILQQHPVDHSNLRIQIGAKQTRISQQKTQISEMSSNVLPALLKDMATLRITRVLHGDHDLKLARQDYFTSKQRKIITCLQSQKARHELLAMLYEVELRRHRETHRLLSATTKQLVKWKSNREKRIVSLCKHAMKSTTLMATDTPRQAVDSGDMFTQRMCALLGVGPSKESPFITIAGLKAALEHLANRLSFLEGIVQTRTSEQTETVHEQETLLMRYQASFPDSDKPQLTIKEYQEESDKLRSVVSSMEKSIKTLLKKYDVHKKTLHSDSSLRTERQLFVYLFTESSRLQTVIAELSRKVNIIASTISECD